MSINGANRLGSNQRTDHPQRDEARFLAHSLAFPLGWLAGPSYEALRSLVAHPVARLYLFALIGLPLFHWAHRFRYTLYDGLQLKHLFGLIAVLCYGAALMGSAVAAYTLWTIR